MEGVSNNPLDERAYRRRSHNQNEFYWAVVIGTLCREFKAKGAATSSEAMHFLLKSMFSPGGRSTTKMNTVQFQEYIIQIQHWAAEKFQIYIPDPNEKQTEASK